MNIIGLYHQMYYGFCLLEERVKKNKYDATDASTFLSGTMILNFGNLNLVAYAIFNIDLNVQPMIGLFIAAAILITNEWYFTRNNRHAKIYKKYSSDDKNYAGKVVLAYFLFSILIFISMVVILILFPRT